MKEDRLKKLCEKYQTRDVMKELEFFFNYPKHGYLTNADSEFLEWLCYAAYNRIKEAEK